MSRASYLKQLVAGGVHSPHLPAQRVVKNAPRLTGNLAPAVSRPVKNFDAAMQGRLTGDWKIDRLSADAELQGKIPIIRSRSRDLERNDPYAENYLLLQEKNIVGHKGFAFEMKALLSESIDPKTGELTPVFDAASNREIERGWKEFCRRETFLTTRNMDATSAFKLIVRTIFRDGDPLIRKVPGYPNKFGFALQLLEPDYLDDQYIEFRGVPCQCPQQFGLPYCQSGLHQVRMGVELHGDWMFPVAYWLLANHPGDYFYGNQFDVRRMRVPVDEIIHPFFSRRIGQTRGIPATVAGMLRLQMFGGYDEATLVKARAAAQKMGFLEKEIPDSIADQYAEQWAAGQATLVGEPGQIEELPMGVTFKPWDPQEPTGNYGPFTKQQLRAYAASGGVSYTSLSNDIENVNFSSIRAGLLEEREGYKGGQEFFITEVVRPIFEAWLPMAILSGEVKVSMARLQEFIDVDAAHFQGRRWPWVDPVKDVTAAITAIDGGLRTRSDVIAEGGGDFEKVTAELAREKKIRAAAGILPPEETAAPDSELEEPEDDEDPEDPDADDPPPNKGAPDQPRDEHGRYASTDGPAVGKTGSWSSLGLKTAEELPVTERPRRITTAEAMQRLSTPYAKEDPLGNAVGFGKRLRDHLSQHVSKSDKLRASFLPHMEAAVEHPAEIWAETNEKGPRLKHIAAFTATNGRRSFAVVSHQVGETTAEIISGAPKDHPGLNKMRTGKLLYASAPA